MSTTNPSLVFTTLLQTRVRTYSSSESAIYRSFASALTVSIAAAAALTVATYDIIVNLVGEVCILCCDLSFALSIKWISPGGVHVEVRWFQTSKSLTVTG